MADILKPCPFCGNDGSGPAEEALHISHTQNDWHPAYDCYSVQCDKCTATMGYSDGEEAAAEAWNMRAMVATPDILALLAEAADFIQPFNRAEELLDRIEGALSKASAVRSGVDNG